VPAAVLLVVLLTTAVNSKATDAVPTPRRVNADFFISFPPFVTRPEGLSVVSSVELTPAKHRRFTETFGC